MYLSKPAKIFVGIATVFVFLIPLLIILIWFYAFFSMATAANLSSSDFPPNRFPFNSFEVMSTFGVPVICSLNVLIYVLVGFYVFHTIKNSNVSDVIRTIAILTFFIVPFLGMPIYYIFFILLPKPPTWMVKKEPAPIYE